MTMMTLLTAMLTVLAVAALITVVNGRDGRPVIRGFDFARAKESESKERAAAGGRNGNPWPRG